MTTALRIVAAALILSVPCGITAHAAPALKAYQVTGPVLDLTDTAVTVQKGTEKWQIARGTAALPANVKVGSKVTVMYTMTATSIAAK